MPDKTFGILLHTVAGCSVRQPLLDLQAESDDSALQSKNSFKTFQIENFSHFPISCIIYDQIGCSFFLLVVIHAIVVQILFLSVPQVDNVVDGLKK